MTQTNMAYTLGDSEHDKEIVTRCAPRWAWDVLDNAVDPNCEFGVSEGDDNLIREAVNAMIAACEKGE